MKESVGSEVLLLKGSRWQLYDKYHPENNITFYGEDVNISENEDVTNGNVITHEAKTSFHVWDTAIAFTKYLENRFNKDYWKGKKILELGAGCGLVGIVLGVAGAKVILTDLPEALPHLKQNANKHPAADIAVAELKWGEQSSLRKFSNTHFDMIVASDILWLEHLVHPLIQTLKALDYDHVLFTFETRSLKVEQVFFRELRSENFKAEEVPLSEMHPEYNSPSIKILTITKQAA
eukprot:TRINITY_DN15_c0_g1_i1.p2 TRINITY_DN15_c0_g1~~TRINITY_DN15_c0_g1_i1.p2  ORF type:complete len:235 (-),score=32.89 TRINITY_DN15_c0_g1_i1:933-1637(-)